MLRVSTKISPETQEALWNHFEHDWGLPAKALRELRLLLGRDPYVRHPRVKQVYRCGGWKGRSWTKSLKTALSYCYGNRKLQVREPKKGEFVDASPLYRLLALERHKEDKEVIFIG